MKVTAIDFETANGNPASVCAVGISVMEDGCAGEAYYSLIRPEDVEDAPDFRTVLKEIRPFFDDAIVCAHNARFDMGCLKAACLNCGLPVPYLNYFDTVALSRTLFPQLPHHRLNDMCSYLDIELEHHLASSDAFGCLMIVAHAMNLTGRYEIGELLSYTHVRIHSL